MATGIVKWYNDAKGFGFVTDEKTGEDVFAHFSRIEMKGFKTLREGQRVSFERVIGPQGSQAEKIYNLEESPPDDAIESFEFFNQVALALVDGRIRFVTWTQDGNCRFLDTKQNLHSIVYVVSTETHKFRLAVEELEFLVNDSKSKEADFQNFFERNPNFILSEDHQRAHPHVVLSSDDEANLIPDFILEPTDQGKLCDLLELKLPRHKVFVGTQKRQRFSSEVAEAAAQLREYRKFFDDETKRNRIKETYDLLTYKPKMYLVIGRREKMDPLTEQDIKTSTPELILQTYDDVVKRSKNILSKML